MKPYNFFNFLQTERGKTPPIEVRLKYDKMSIPLKELKNLPLELKIQYVPHIITPDDLHVKHTLTIANNNRNKLPRGLVIEGSLDIVGCTYLARLPNDLSISRYLFADHSGITTIPHNLVVERDAYFGGTPLWNAIMNQGERPEEVIRKMIESKGGRVNGNMRYD